MHNLDRPPARTRYLDRLNALIAFMLMGIGVVGAANLQPPTGEKNQMKNHRPIYICPPCGCASDGKTFDQPGTCPSCGMGLVRQVDRKQPYKVAIVLFQGVELLDFSGPGETFAATMAAPGHGFEVFTVAKTTKQITSQGFLKIEPTYSIADCPKPDIVVIPGGNVGNVTQAKELMTWIQERAKESEIVFSVCNGAIVLAELGLLDGLEATTHWSAIARLKQRAPKTRVVSDKRVVDNGKIVTAAGVSAGIDGALHLVTRLYGPEAAANTARYMEYRWAPPESGKAKDFYGAALHHANERSADALALLKQSFEQGHEQPSAVLSEPALNRLRHDPAQRMVLRKLLAEHCRESRIELVAADEPGQRLTLDMDFMDQSSGQPLADTLIYLYQTDAAGDYVSGAEQPGGGSDNPRLFAYVRTDAQGRAQIRTILPGCYRGTRAPRHIHLEVSRPNRTYGTGIYFDGDPPADDEIRQEAARGRHSIVTPKPAGAGLATQVTIRVPKG